MAFLAGLLLAGAAAGPARARAARPEGLFAPVKRGGRVAPGWTLRSVKRRAGQFIEAELTGADGGRGLVIRLIRRDKDVGAFCRTRSFNIVYLTASGGRSRTPVSIHRVMEAVCRLVNNNDRGQIKLGPYVPSRARGGYWIRWNWTSWPNLLFLITFGLLVWILHYRPALSRRRAWLGEMLERNPWPVLGVLCAAMAVPRLMHLGMPFDADYMTQRVFFGSLDLGDILAHRGDQRHPQLYFLVLHVFLWFGHGEWIVRLPAVVFSLATAVALFVLLRPYLGAVRSLASVALLGLTTSFLICSRDVSNVTLFMFLWLTACHLFLRCLDRPTRRLLVFFALTEVAMFYSYYMAGLVALSQLAVLAIHGRSRRYRELWVAMALSFLVALPTFRDLAMAMRGDILIRQVSQQFPSHVWGETSLGQFLGQLAGMMVPAGSLGLLAAGLAALGAGRWLWWRWKEPGAQLLLIVMGIAVLMVTAALFHLRINAYYLLFVLPVFVVTIVLGALGLPPTPSTSPGTDDRGHSGTPTIEEDEPGEKTGRWAVATAQAVQWMALALMFLAYGAAMIWTTPRLMSAEGRDHYLRVGKAIQSQGGPDTVVADPDSMYTILLYYVFPRPLAMYRTCRISGGWPVSCRHGKRRLVTLTAMAQMRRGWEQESLRRLKALGSKQLWFVHFERFKNAPLLAHLKAHCAKKGKWGPLTLYRCPPLPGSTTPVPEYLRQAKVSEVHRSGAGFGRSW